MNFICILTQARNLHIDLSSAQWSSNKCKYALFQVQTRGSVTTFALMPTSPYNPSKCHAHLTHQRATPPQPLRCPPPKEKNHPIWRKVTK